MVRIPKERELPWAGIVPAPAPNGEQPAMITGNWRTLRTILDKETCTQCRECWTVCPDACIIESDEGFSVNLKYCKGCGLCMSVCPSGSISRVPEIEFEDGVVRLEKPF